MRAYRLTRSKYPAFSGRGSLLANGGWHWAGVPVVYCAESRALAVLEALVHTRKDQIPSDYVFFELVIDDSVVRMLSTHEIPADWRGMEACAGEDNRMDEEPVVCWVGRPFSCNP